ncbi:hypothetical protein MBLNU230_g7555t1 [Neophaeotheca triangularis]
MEDKYTHEPLEHKRSFRALILHPSLDTSTELSCDLQELDLDPSNPCRRFEALSYVWGSPTDSVAVKCCGKRLSVTRNCAAALRMLRRTKRSRTIFVDAICIDQTNHEERAQQVKLMGEIYRRAGRVLVWLGPGSPSTTWAFRHFVALERLRPFLEVELGGIREEGFAEKARELVWRVVCRLQVEEITECLHEGHLHPWLDFMDTTYFERVWTLQETSVSTNAVLICGQSWCSFESARFAHRLLRPFWFEMIASADYASSFWNRLDGFNTHTDLQWVHRLLQQHEGGPKFWYHLREVLVQARSLRATDSRDKLYSLYAIFRRVCEHYPEPDYNRPMSVVCILATVAIIKASNTLDMLAEVSNEETSLEFPSWAFDWEGDSVDLRWMVPEDFWFKKLPRLTAWDPPPVFDLSPPRPSMRVQGSVHSTISKTSAAPDSAREFYHRLYLNAKSGTRCDEREEEQALLEMSRTMYAWSALSADAAGSSTQADKLRLLHDVLTWEMSSENLEFSAFTTWHATLMGKPPELDEASWLSELKMFGDEFHERVCARKASRSFFVTSSGVQGDTHHSVRPDDLLVLLCWSRLPAILRQSGDGHRLIGFAFADGLMDCSAWGLRSECLTEYILM